jgi:hypothetical protein
MNSATKRPAVGLVVRVAALAALGAVLLAPGEAQAQKRAKVTDLGEVLITGRVQKPVAAVDITRLAPKLSLSELRQPFLDRIEQALYGEPF